LDADFDELPMIARESIPVHVARCCTIRRAVKERHDPADPTSMSSVPLTLAVRYRRMTPRLVDGLILTLPLLPYPVLWLLAGQGVGFDFHVFWAAAREVAHGGSPYDPAGVAHMRALAQGHPTAHPVAPWAVYPPQLFVALVPFGLLPWHVAAPIAMSLLALSPVLALWVMGVRDWRCYLVAYGSAPIATSIMLGTITPLLMLGLALLWRGRSVVAAGSATIVAKLFLWPFAIVVASLYTVRRALVLIAAAALSTTVAWAIIGFADVTRYPKILSDLSAVEAHNSFSVAGLAYGLGLPTRLGTGVGLVLGAGACWLAFRAGRRGQRDASFMLALVAALVLSPIVWLHYLALLFVPLAARRPRFDGFWLVPVVLWSYKQQAPYGTLWPFLVFWGCVALVTYATLRPDGDRGLLRRTGDLVRRLHEPRAQHARLPMG
jgi:hypothetical protein